MALAPSVNTSRSLRQGVRDSVYFYFLTWLDTKPEGPRADRTHDTSYRIRVLGAFLIVARVLRRKSNTSCIARKETNFFFPAVSLVSRMRETGRVQVEAISLPS